MSTKPKLYVEWSEDREGFHIDVRNRRQRPPDNYVAGFSIEVMDMQKCHAARLVIFDDAVVVGMREILLHILDIFADLATRQLDEYELRRVLHDAFAGRGWRKRP